jgi:hypothetical protein
MHATCTSQVPRSRKIPAAQAKDGYGLIAEISCSRPHGNVERGLAVRIQSKSMRSGSRFCFGEGIGKALGLKISPTTNAKINNVETFASRGSNA